MAPGAAPAAPGSTIDCHVTSSPASDVNLDCAGQSTPVGEPSVAVDPLNPRHVVASGMDELRCCWQFSTTFDGGRTWTNGEISRPPAPTGVFATNADTVVVFDRRFHDVVHVGLALAADPATGDSGDSSVIAANSGRGISWSRPVVVAQGHGLGPKQLFNDKPWVVVDNNPRSRFYGRLYVTWSRLAESGESYAKSAPYGLLQESQSDDGGWTWSRPRTIGGSSRKYCSRPQGGYRGGTCLGEFSFPAVAPDGSVYVAFLNTQHSAGWRPHDGLADQYLLVHSGDGGLHWSPPVHVLDMVDGVRDYPIGPQEGPTLSGWKNLVTVAGNLAISPRTGELDLVFSDNRAGRQPVRHPVTRTKIYLMRSRDGVDWQGPAVVSGPGGRDDWQPFAAFSPRDGRLGVLYYHRSAGQPNLFRTVLAETADGQHFVRRTLSRMPSHPTRAAWFISDSGNPYGPGEPPCRQCVQWAGDYVGLTYGPDGRAYAVWTGLRRWFIPPAGDPFSAAAPGYTHDIFLASVADPLPALTG